MSEVRMLPLQRMLAAQSCLRAAEGLLVECRRAIALAEQHPGHAGEHLSNARTWAGEAGRILKHGEDAHLSAVLVVDAVGLEAPEAVNA